jgi:nicotinic acid phosphoribosyltransferase
MCILYSMEKPQQILCISITGPFLKIMNYEKKVLYIIFSLFLISKSFAQVAEISSPDGQLKLHVFRRRKSIV